MEGRTDAIKYPELGSALPLTSSATGRATWRLYQICFPWYSTVTTNLFMTVERAGASVKPNLTACLKELPEVRRLGHKGDREGRVHFCHTVSHSDRAKVDKASDGSVNAKAADQAEQASN